MKRRKLAGNQAPASMEHVRDLPPLQCHCDELAPVIEELTRQIHLLGVIIDGLVSEFQWQNNQMAEYIRQADDATKRPQPTITAAVEPRRFHRKLFQ